MLLAAQWLAVIACRDSRRGHSGRRLSAGEPRLQVYAVVAQMNMHGMHFTRSAGQVGEARARDRVAQVRRAPTVPPIVSLQSQLLAMQRAVGNQAVQRLIGAPGTMQAGQPVPFTLNAVFIAKHVADTAEEAKTKTLARITNGDALPSMVNGTLGNTVATQAAWTAAIARSIETIPPEDDYWTAGEAVAAERLHHLKVEIEGWEATPATVRTLPTSKRTVGGTYQVNANSVTVDIDHASTSRG